MNGFLGTRGSLMLDIVVVGMLLCVPLMAYSIRLVRAGRNFTLHRNLQLLIASILLVAVVAFEVEMRVWGWESRAEGSRYWIAGRWNDWVDRTLLIHLVFAIPTPILWFFVIFRAYRKFPSPPIPGAHSPSHRFWGRLAAFGLLGTAVTGWLFYWVAFV